MELRPKFLKKIASEGSNEDEFSEPLIDFGSHRDSLNKMESVEMREGIKSIDKDLDIFGSL